MTDISTNNKRILRKPEVINKTGLSSTTIWRLEKQGKFPKSIVLSPNARGWLEEEINKWIDERITSRDEVCND